MESYGIPGSIQVTQRVRDRLGERYRFRERGEITVKGKGEMLTYLLVGRADDAAVTVGLGHQRDMSRP